MPVQPIRIKGISVIQTIQNGTIQCSRYLRVFTGPSQPLPAAHGSSQGQAAKYVTLYIVQVYISMTNSGISAVGCFKSIFKRDSAQDLSTRTKIKKNKRGELLANAHCFQFHIPSLGKNVLLCFCTLQHGLLKFQQPRIFTFCSGAHFQKLDN